MSYFLTLFYDFQTLYKKITERHLPVNKSVVFQNKFNKNKNLSKKLLKFLSFNIKIFQK